jgi:hypothetical protein
VRSSLALIAIVCSAPACSSERYAERPMLPDRSTAPDIRERAYAESSLSDRSTFWSRKYVRSDGEYDLAQIDPLIESYAATHQLKEDARVRSRVIDTISGLGQAAVAVTLFYNLSTNDQNRWPTSTQAALYAAGATLIVGAIVTGILWSDPIDRVADTYNEMLRRELRLPKRVDPPPDEPGAPR